MSFLPDNLWKRIEKFEPASLVDNRQQLHQAIQNVATVGRTFLPPSDDDCEATLVWIPSSSRMAGKWVQGAIKFRSSINPESFTVHLVDASLTTMNSLSLAGMKQGSVMVWLGEQITLLGLNASEVTLNLPYQLPEYPQAKRKPFDPETSCQKLLADLYHNAWLVLSQVTNNAGGFGELLIWPHHFDMGTLQIVKDTGDPETSASVGVGMSPGDEEFEEPYFYVNVWPYPSIEEFPPLTNGFWYEDQWVGAVLKISDIIKEASASLQHRMVLEFFNEAHYTLRATIK